MSSIIFTPDVTLDTPGLVIICASVGPSCVCWLCRTGRQAQLLWGLLDHHHFMLGALLDHHHYLLGASWIIIMSCWWGLLDHNHYLWVLRRLFLPNYWTTKRLSLFNTNEYYAKGRWCRTLMMWVWFVGRDERAKCFWSARRHSLLLWPWCIDKQTDFTILWETFWHPFIIMGCDICCWTSFKTLFFSTELLDQP